MGLFWTVMFVVSLSLLVAGLVRPAIFSPLFGAGFSRGRAALLFGAIFIVIIILGTIFPAKPS